jgi:diguanylate cyclase (GGDEF)-like protein
VIELGSEQLLEIVLAVAAAAMAAVAAVFVLVLYGTRRVRGRGWMWGFAYFALTLALDAFAQHYPALEGPLTYAATAAAAASSFCTSAATFDLLQRRMPAWAYGLLGFCTAGGFAVAVTADLTADLLAPEFALMGSMAILSIALFPAARAARGAGMRTVCAVAAFVSLFICRTLIFSAVLAGSGRELNAVYWTWEVIFGVLMAFVLAMGELVALLERIRFEIEETNAALNKALEGLEIAAKIDPLTGLHNRYSFYTLVDELRERGKLGGSIVILDLNDLKKINDTYGHHAGDRALLSVAQRVRAAADGSEYVFRWGGDEFVLLLFGVSTGEARRRLSAMEPPQPLDLPDGGRAALALSWGVAPLREDVEGALRDADTHLYDHKRSAQQSGKAALS